MGRASCPASRHGTSASPKVIVKHGAATDNNATLFAQGYFGVLTPLFNSGGWTDVEGARPGRNVGSADG